MPYPEASTIAWWWFAGLGFAAVSLYFVAKLALIRWRPSRFGHLRFP